MLAPSTMPYNDLRQANAYAKSNPGKISFGSPGNRSLIHISLEHWKRQAGLNIVHVQYKGEGDVVKALLSGEVQLGVVSLVNGGPMIKGGRVKAIATPSPSRLPGYPDVQTFEDIGVKDIDLWNYTGLHVPAGTPASAIQTLRSASIGALNSAETKKRFAEMGGVSVGNTAEEYGSFIAGEVRRWQGVVKSLGTEFE